MQCNGTPAGGLIVRCEFGGSQHVADGEARHMGGLRFYVVELLDRLPIQSSNRNVQVKNGNTP